MVKNNASSLAEFAKNYPFDFQSILKMHKEKQENVRKNDPSLKAGKEMLKNLPASELDKSFTRSFVLTNENNFKAFWSCLIIETFS